MLIQKLNITNTELDNERLNISDEEILTIHKTILLYYDKYLKRYGVKKLWKDNISMESIQKNRMTAEDVISKLDAKELQLIFLYKHKGNFVHKDLISKFVRMKKPNAALDQQVRHLSTQNGWNVLNKGNTVPDENIKVPSGYHYLITLQYPSISIMDAALKRQGRLAAENFEDLKVVYDHKCATCGIKEGSPDPRNNDVEVVLQQGHMDPNQELTINNTIPQCQYCNQTYKDNFVFDEHGRVKSVNNPEFLLRSTRKVKDKMIEILLEDRRKCDQ